MARFDLDDLFAPTSSDDVFSDYISDSEVELGDYDEDGCYNVDGVNGLLEEYLNNARGMFTEGFKNLIRQVYLKQRKLDKLSARMWDRKKALRDMQKEIDEAKAKLNNYKADCGMEYLKQLGLLSFKPGQKVYVVDWEQIKDGICPKCNGKGKLFVEVEGIQYVAGCPVCNPTNGSYNVGNTSHTEYFIKEGVISSMSFYLEAYTEDKDIDRDRDSKTKEIKLSDYYSSYSPKRIYIKFKGNRDTSDVPEYRIFATKEEAEKYIEDKKADSIGSQAPRFE